MYIHNSKKSYGTWANIHETSPDTWRNSPARRSLKASRMFPSDRPSTSWRRNGVIIKSTQRLMVITPHHPSISSLNYKYSDILSGILSGKHTHTHIYIYSYIMTFYLASYLMQIPTFSPAFFFGILSEIWCSRGPAVPTEMLRGGGSMGFLQVLRPIHWEVEVSWGATPNPPWKKNWLFPHKKYPVFLGYPQGDPQSCSEHLQRQDLRHQTPRGNPFARLAQRTLEAQDGGGSWRTQGGRTQPGKQWVVPSGKRLQKTMEMAHCSWVNQV